MCDMRGAPEFCKDLEGNISFLKKFNGGVSIQETKWLEEGIYHVGASGCGYYHYDGEYILDLDGDYKYKINKDNKFYGYDCIRDEWKNSKYEYGVKSGEVNLFGSEGVNYNYCTLKNAWLNYTTMKEINND